MGSVRETFEHADWVEIPDGGPAHYVNPQGSKYSEVYGCVHLFHEAILFCAGFDAVREGQRTEELLHDKFAGEC